MRHSVRKSARASEVARILRDMADRFVDDESFLSHGMVRDVKFDHKIAAARAEVGEIEQIYD